MSERAGTSRREVGERGEELAASWYRVRGYQVLDRNWRCPEGELDLVLRRQGTVVFCEVRTRTTDRFGSGAESVSFHKRRRVRHLAVRWLAAGGARRLGGAVDIRFDVVSITGGELEVTEAAF